MGAFLRLERQDTQLDLNGSIYKAQVNGFAPPSFRVVPVTSGQDTNILSSSTKPAQKLFRTNINLLVKGDTPSVVSDHIEYLNSYLQQSGDALRQTYLIYRAFDDFDYESDWGKQGRFERYEVVSGRVANYASFSNLFVSNSNSIQVELTLAPIDEGLPIDVLWAGGYIHEDYFGTNYGTSKGISIMPALTNYIASPTSLDGALDETIFDETQGIGFGVEGVTGSPAVELIKGGDSGGTSVESVTTGSTAAFTFSAFVRRRDKQAVSSADVRVHYNGTNHTDSTYTNWGNGWYLIHRQFTTTVSTAVNLGLWVAADTAVFYSCPNWIAGERVYYPIWRKGWGGSESGVTQVSTVGRTKFPRKNYTEEGGTVRFVWYSWHDETEFSGAGDDLVFLSSFFEGIEVGYDGTNNKFTITDGTNSGSGSVFNYEALTPIVFHFVYGRGGMKLYVNGVEDINVAGWDSPTGSREFHLGHDKSYLNHAAGTFMGFAPFTGIQMSASDVLADFNNIAPLVNHGDSSRLRMIDPIPYVWGNSAGGAEIRPAMRHHHTSSINMPVVIGGLMGRAARWDAALLGDYGVTDWAVAKAFRIGAFHMEQRFINAEVFIDTGTIGEAFLFYQGSGTAGTGAESNSDYNEISIDTTGATISLSPSSLVARMLQNKGIYILARIYDAGSNLQIAPKISGGNTNNIGEFRDVTTTTAFNYYRTEPIFGDWIPSSSLTRGVVQLGLYLKRSTGSAANVRIDYYWVMPEGMTIKSEISAGSSAPFMVLTNDQAYVGDYIEYAATKGTRVAIGDKAEVFGKQFDLLPGHYNVVFGFMGDEEGGTTSINYKTDVYLWRVFPRY